jgi:hypothetical protein
MNAGSHGDLELCDSVTVMVPVVRGWVGQGGSDLWRPVECGGSSAAWGKGDGGSVGSGEGGRWLLPGEGYWLRQGRPWWKGEEAAVGAGGAPSRGGAGVIASLNGLSRCGRGSGEWPAILPGRCGPRPISGPGQRRRLTRKVFFLLPSPSQSRSAPPGTPRKWLAPSTAAPTSSLRCDF